MTRPDLEPTERIPVVADGPGSLAAPVLERHGPSVFGFLGPVLLLLVIGSIGLIAAALLLTPTRESVLIMGSDARPDEIKQGLVGRTDTMMFFFADRAAARTALLSVARDLWVTIPGHGEERINAAYELGGPGTAKQTVSNTIGQPVDRYLVIGLQGVRDVVDALGGIDITVPYAIHDDAYPTDDYGYQTVDIRAGPQHMDGDIALKYARTRHQDNDFARQARQQQVLGAVRSAAFKPANWPHLPAVVVAVYGSIKTDLTPLDAIALGAALLRSPGEPDRLVIDTRLANEVTGVDGAYLLEPKPALKPTVAQFLAGPSAVSVDVLNGAGIAGLAARTADRLTQAGFVVVNVGDAPKAVPQTTILAKPNARPAADQLASTLGVPTSRISTSSSLTAADIQLTLGPDAH